MKNCPQCRSGPTTRTPAKLRKTGARLNAATADSSGAALADASSSVSTATATAAARQAPLANVKNRGMTQPDRVW
jgi:hypothetical protein